MNMKKNFLAWVALWTMLSMLPFTAIAKSKKNNSAKTPYVFSIEKEINRTPVKNQYKTGTCWCFSTISYLESELLRLGKEELDLSEMFVVRNTYPRKAANFVRMHGHANHSQGGQSHDVLEQIQRFGIVPEAVYPGLNIDEKRHNHGEMDAVLQGILDAILKRARTRITPRWLDAYEAVLDIYLGKIPQAFVYQGVSYSPKSFADDYLQFNYEDYIELTSYDIYPFYQKCRLEIPDNWTYDSNYYNVPIDVLENIVDQALKSGYSFVWDGDVSERDFSRGRSDTEHGTGYAIIPEKDWEDKTKAERKGMTKGPLKEREISQAMRTKTFNDFSTTDDHLMHVVGLAHDQKGTKFYLTKNSSGTDQPYGGYAYLSRSFFRLKTTAIMINKHALQPEIKEKLSIK
ncbi:aminopeptidase [candidate division KSB1 bacterium]|nr:aminopeptidase [Candidatus Aminicenantes bacterium]RQW03603.1 MAG: aminopeptidase [candidate division KSB1 bacterium]